jgi:hypothetical protein
VAVRFASDDTTAIAALAISLWKLTVDPETASMAFVSARAPKSAVLDDVAARFFPACRTIDPDDVTAVAVKVSR